MNPKSKPNSNKRPFKKNGFKSKPVKEEDTGKAVRASHNDAAWYCSNGQAIKDVASISFNTALGQDLTLRSAALTGGFKFSVPGVMSILTVPTVGAGKNHETPVNIAARDVYSYVRHANSGHSNYDPADLMVYLMSMDSIYSFWAWMVRMYGTLRVFSRMNRYVGDVYVTAMGGDPNDLRHNMADFRAYINMFAQSAMALSVPKTMPYFIRHSWMYSNIYKDEDTSKASVYMYTPAAFFRYNSTISAGGGGLECVNLTATMQAGRISGILPNTLQMITSYGDMLLRAVLGDEDIGIMSGDILKAYGADNLWKLEYIPEDYAVIPVFSEEVLAQIHNTTFVGGSFVADNGDGTGTLTNYNSAFNVFQDPNVDQGILYSEPIANAARHLTYDRIVDFWHEDVSPEQVIVATRNQVTGEDYPLTGDGIIRPTKILACGSDVCLVGIIYTLKNGILTNSVVGVFDTSSAIADTFGDYERFNEAPVFLHIVNATGVADAIIGEVDNYAFISVENLYNMHQAALLSLFNVPNGK